MNNTPHLFTTQEAAVFLNLKAGTLEVWRVYGRGPRFMKLGRSVRYRLSDLNQFINDSSRTSTTSIGG